MSFLDQIFLDNTVRSYLIEATVILFLLLFRRILSKYVAALVYELIRRNWPQIKKKQFIELIIAPLSWFLLVTITVMAIDRLNFPSILNASMYKTDVESIVRKLGVTIIIIAIVNFLVSLINFIALLIKDNSVDKHERAHHQLILFFKDFIKAIFYVVGLMLILKFVFSVNIGTLVGGLGIAGAALALAARESIENIIASFIIFLDKPFFTGDSVKVNAYAGRVERIGLRSTRIRTTDKTLITVPNKQMVDSVVDNLSFRNYRRAEVKLNLSSAFSPEKIKDFLAAAEALLESHKDDLTTYSAFVTDYTKDTIVVTVEFFTIPIPVDDFTALKQEMYLELLKLMQEKGSDDTVVKA